MKNHQTFFEFLYRRENRNIPLLAKIKYNLPITKEDLHVKGDLYLEFNEELKSLPLGLIVDGELNLFGSSIEVLPKNLKVDGDLSITRSQITRLPENLYVGGDLYANELPILHMPKKMTIQGEFHAWDTMIRDSTGRFLDDEELHEEPGIKIHGEIWRN